MLKKQLEKLLNLAIPEKFFLSIVLFLFGVFISSFLNFDLGLWIAVVFLIFSSVFTFEEFLFKKRIFLSIYLIVFSLGFFYFQFYEFYQQKHSSLFLNGSSLSNIEAVIVSLPVYQEKTVELEAKLLLPYQGKILIKTNQYFQHFQYGDKIIFSGKFEEPKSFNDFDYKSYLAKSNIYSIVKYPKIEIQNHHQGFWLKDFLYQLRVSFQKQVDKIFKEPQSSFLNGLLLGDKRNLDKNLEIMLQKTGTIHLIALSGFNITIITAAVFAFLLSLGIARPKAFWLVVIFVFCFVILTGASASVVRAGIMGIVFVLSQKIGKPYQIRNALFFAAFIMLLLNPKILRFDFGFQLSFAATLGLIYLLPFFNNLFKVEKGGFLKWREIVATTFAAQIFVLPILILRFGYISIISPITNVLIISLIPYTMLLGFIAVLLSYLSLWLGIIFGFAAHTLLSLEIKIINLFGSLKFAVINFGKYSELVFWLSLLIFISYLIYKQKRKYEFISIKK